MKAKLLAVFAGFVFLFIAFVSVRPASAQRNGRHGNYFPNTELITQDGKKVHFYDDLIKDKVVAITMIYTQCKYNCPLETARMRQVQKELGDHAGKDVFFISISLDPEHDTPEVLHDYAEMYNAGPGWTFLTGKKADITALSTKLGLNTPVDPEYLDGHTPALLIGNEKTGQWMEEAAGDNPRFLAVQIEKLLPYQVSAPQAAQATTQAQPQTKETSQLQTWKLNPGRYLFARECAACHTIGHGDKIGPDLQGVTNQRTDKWLHEFVSAPDKMLDKKDPVAMALYERYKHLRMPNLTLNDQDVDTIIRFLKSEDAAPGTPRAEGPAQKTLDASK
jgi:protein SCO1/2